MTDFNANDAMIDLFLFETSQLLEQLEQVVLSSDAKNSYSDEDINEIFRIMHTIKGSSAMMMYNDISHLSHVIEDLFFYIREEKPEQNFCNSLNDLILESVDFIKLELDKIKNGGNPDGDPAILISKLKDYLSILKNNGNNSVNDIKEEKINAFKAVLYYEEGCEMENIRAYSTIRDLEKITEKLVYYPEDILDNDDSAEVIRCSGFKIYLKTAKTQEEILNFLKDTIFLKDLDFTEIDDETFAKASNKTSDDEADKNCCQKDILNIHAQKEDCTTTDIKKIQPNKIQKENSTEHQSSLATQNIISVNVAKLDKLMDLVGEMVIAEAMVLQNPDLEGLELNNFYKAASQLNKITTEIQDMVMSVRMVPLANTFHRMNRIVRDMCRKLNKEIQLVIIGEETEVDKNIIEHITDPLMHLVRNSTDHGIEIAEERELKGKPVKGTITLEAKNAGSDVHIIVKDDGRGLDRDKIVKRARENGLLRMDEADMSDSEVYKLILMPGFSTKTDITEYSGRGVGMDVVTKNIEAIGGSISIESQKDVGTQITIKIPLTLAIIDGMNLKVGKSTYTIPTISIQESFRPDKQAVIVDSEGNEMIMVRGEFYPILRLHRILKAKTNITNLSEGIITMVSQEGKTVCVFADRLLGQQQVVVKSLPEYIKRYKKIRGISGCTLLGDGSISLILDIAGLLNIK
ncbi:MAG: chemotaxis protein CheA [Clostridiaceae bacterium]|nr:chemotaxis protein CheA [Clostridiaceae bacterium]